MHKIDPTVSSWSSMFTAPIRGLWNIASYPLKAYNWIAQPTFNWTSGIYNWLAGVQSAGGAKPLANFNASRIAFNRPLLFERHFKQVFPPKNTSGSRDSIAAPLETKIGSITLRDFQPINTWEPESNGRIYDFARGEKTPEFLIDLSTDRRYWNESPGCVRFKCLLLSLGTPLVHLIASVINVAYRVLRLISFSHFWISREGEKHYNLKGRITDAAADLLRIVVTPLSLIGLELAAIYGVFNPYDGRKLYASIERATYEGFFLAPCFQPDPKRHLFGGDINQRDAW